MRDVLEVLRSLSLFLQKRTTSIIDAKDKLETDMKTLMALKTVDGSSLRAVKKQMSESGAYEGIVLTRVVKDEQSFTQIRLQFIQALVDNLRARFPQYQFLEAGACLGQMMRMSVHCNCDQHVLHLAKLCHVNAAEVLSEFREYKNNTRHLGRSLQTLLQRLCLFPVSSAEWIFVQ